MKKIALILSTFALFLSTNVFAADVLGTFSDYTYLLRQSFNVDTSDQAYLSDTIAHQFVRLSVVTLGPMLRGDKAVFHDTTVYHKDHYGLDTTIWGISSVQWVHADTVKTLKWIPQSRFGETYQQMAAPAQTAVERRPYFYDHIDDTLFVFPAPIRNGDTLRIVAWKKVPSIAASDNLSGIPQKYRSPIFHFAAYLIARAKQHPLTALYRQDYQEAMTFAMTHGGQPIAEKDTP